MYIGLMNSIVKNQATCLFSCSGQKLVGINKHSENVGSENRFTEKHICPYFLIVLLYLNGKSAHANRRCKMHAGSWEHQKIEKRCNIIFSLPAVQYKQAVNIKAD